MWIEATTDGWTTLSQISSDELMSADLFFLVVVYVFVLFTQSVCHRFMYVCVRACLFLPVCVVCILIIIKKEVEDEDDGATKVLRNECFCLCVCVCI